MGKPLRKGQIRMLAKALELTQFGFNGRCPVCTGWNMSPSGETDGKHTATCPVGRAIQVLGDNLDRPSLQQEKWVIPSPTRER